MHDKAAIPQAGSRRPVCVHLFNLIVIKGGVSIIILVIIIVVIIVTRPSHTDHFIAMFVVRIKVTNNHGDPKDPVIGIIVITKVFIMVVKSLADLNFGVYSHGLGQHQGQRHGLHYVCQKSYIS